MIVTGAWEDFVFDVATESRTISLSVNKVEVTYLSHAEYEARLKLLSVF